MNLRQMTEELSHLRSEWERNCFSLDIVEKPDWTRGVAYGLRLAMRLVHQHMEAPHLTRGNSRTPYLDSRDKVVRS
jgi:hypothetical protein